MEHLAGYAVGPSAHTWDNVARRDFGLTPKELATLAAIGAYVRSTGQPMPRAALEAAAAIAHDDPKVPRVDLATPGRLFESGLINLVGSRAMRSYDITVAGSERLQR